MVPSVPVIVVMEHYSALYKDRKCPIKTSHVGSSQVWSRFLRYKFGNETRRNKRSHSGIVFSNVTAETKLSELQQVNPLSVDVPPLAR